MAAALLCALAAVASNAPADAQSTQERLDAAKREVGVIKSEMDRIAEGFAEADQQQHHTEHRIDETKAEIGETQDDIEGLRGKLKERVRRAYRERGIGFFQLLLEAESFREFNVRLMSLQRQTLADEDLVLQLRKKTAELNAKKQQLAVQETVFKQRKESYESQAKRATISLQQANALANRLKDQLSREQIARLFSINKTTGGRNVGLAACPVGHPNIVTNSFGAPRGGGTRRHQGNDIMANHGVGIYAVNDGTITRTGSGGLGGLSVYLWDGTNEYYYAHLSSISARGGRVAAGQRIGSNGNTGNASGGPPHLHFEIHPGGGGAIDPYPSLASVC